MKGKIIRITACMTVALMLVISMGACTQTYAPPKSSAELNGVSSGTGYSNDYLGFNMTYPKSYTILSLEQIDSNMKSSIDYIKSMYTDPDQAQKIINQNVSVATGLKHPFGYSEGFNSNFNIIIKYVPSSLTRDTVSLVKNAAEEAKKQFQDATIKDPVAVKLGGKDAAFYDAVIRISGYDIHERQYCFISKDYGVIITITSMDEVEMNELVQMVESITFY